MARQGDELFNVTMTKAEQAAADEVWRYIQTNSIGMQVLEIPKNTRTNLTTQEVFILEKNKSPHSVKKGSLIVNRKVGVPILEIDENDIDFLEQRVHRVYSSNGNEIWVPTFQIGCNPSVRFSDIIGNESFTSSNILREAAKVLCGELDYQVYDLLLAVLDGKRMISEDEVDVYLKKPSYESIIVSRAFTNDNRIHWNTKITDDDFQVKNAGFVRDKNGEKIPVHFIASEEGIMFIGKRNGDLIIDHEPYIIKNRDATKLRVNLAIFFGVGMVGYEGIGAYYRK
jgi:hypothetical protein